MTQEMTIGEKTHSKPVITLMVLKRNSRELTRPSQSGVPSPNQIGGSLLMVLQLVPRLQLQKEEFRRRLPVRPVRLSPGNTFAGITSRLPVVGAPNRLAIRMYVRMYVRLTSVLPKSRAARMYVRMYVSHPTATYYTHPTGESKTLSPAVVTPRLLFHAVSPRAPPCTMAPPLMRANPYAVGVATMAIRKGNAAKTSMAAPSMAWTVVKLTWQASLSQQQST
jgi:hypothetical protein